MLFVGYLSMGAFTYDYLAINYIFFEGKKDFNIVISLIVYLETSIVFLTTILASALISAHFIMALTNISTIEYMKGKPFIYPGCYNEETAAGNHHNLGYIPNFLQIFGSNPIL